MTPIAEPECGLGPYALYMIYSVGGIPAPPAAFRVAAAAFNQATADYEAQKYLPAARGFLGAAVELRTIDGDARFSATAKKNRVLCYKNAALAFAMADASADSQRELERARQVDLGAVEEITKLLEKLPRPLHPCRAEGR